MAGRVMLFFISLEAVQLVVWVWRWKSVANFQRVLEEILLPMSFFDNSAFQHQFYDVCAVDCKCLEVKCAYTPCIVELLESSENDKPLEQFSVSSTKLTDALTIPNPTYFHLKYQWTTLLRSTVKNGTHQSDDFPGWWDTVKNSTCQNDGFPGWWDIEDTKYCSRISYIVLCTLYITIIRRRAAHARKRSIANCESGNKHKCEGSK